LIAIPRAIDGIRRHFFHAADAFADAMISLFSDAGAAAIFADTRCVYAAAFADDAFAGFD